MSQTLNLNHNPIVYTYNKYMKKCDFFLINFFNSNLICYNIIKNRFKLS